MIDIKDAVLILTEDLSNCAISCNRALQIFFAIAMKYPTLKSKILNVRYFSYVSWESENHLASVA